MKKNPKTSFGILEDGQIIKMACLQRDGYHLYLMNLDYVELDKPLYVTPEQLAEYEKTRPSGEEINLDEFASEYVTGLKQTPWDRMFGSVRLDSGVIAINVSEENLSRGLDIPESAAAERVFLRSNLTPQHQKNGEWQTSRFDVGGTSQIWLHQGPNQLYELLKTYGKRNKKNLYYQLADANDIALADHYRTNNLGDGQRHLLVYLGREFRKAFLFDQGGLVDIYNLNITQDLPEAELIHSRVSLALDNAQQPEPDRIVICGDLASDELVRYFNKHDSGRTSLLSFPNLTVFNGKADLYNEVFLAQFALPIALAQKALFPDEARYTPSNFLTRKQIEAQRTFKVAWHGYLILGLIFALALLGTIAFLTVRSNLKHEKEAQRRLQHELAVLQVEAAEIARMKAELEQFKRNTEVIRGVIQGKNPWSEVLDTLNRVAQARPISWLTNLKRNGERLQLSGVTTNRNHVIDIAATLPQSRIQRVTSAEIRDFKVWNFEIASDFPSVDWVAKIEAETAELLARNRAEKEKATLELAAAEQAAAAQEAAEMKAAQTMTAAEKKALEARTAAEKKAAEARAVAEKAAAEKPAAAQPAPAPAPRTASTTGNKLPSIDKAYMPQPSDWQKQAPANELAAYNAFIAAVNRGDKQGFKQLGYDFINKYPQSRLNRLLRWHFANKLYIYGEYIDAKVVLDPLVRYVDAHYPYALLLAARIDHQTGYDRYRRLYNLMQKDYAEHPMQGQVQADIAAIGRGGAQ
ncbi:MAG: hypothetical protein K0B87_03055 [Candidatus Syntrophosphaera sp.]|nr:hypothetical protein [Candidatus Syntrophosphaera sp.]